MIYYIYRFMSKILKSSSINKNHYFIIFASPNDLFIYKATPTPAINIQQETKKIMAGTIIGSNSSKVAFNIWEII